MSSLTTNLKLVKPELQDNITPTIFADNFDKIDAALEGVSGGALSLEEIKASTNLDGKIPSAAALKEVNNSLGEDKNGMTVHEKLDWLMGKGITLTEVGEIEGNGTISATSIENYQNLTANNFIMTPVRMNVVSTGGSTGNGNGTINPSLTYDSSTGTISVTGAKYIGGATNGKLQGILTNKIYLVY